MNARGMAADRHIPVLRDRIVELLAPVLSAPGAVYLDGTLGMGGHAEAILERCPAAHVVGIDRDQEALALAAERLAPMPRRSPSSTPSTTRCQGPLPRRGSTASTPRSTTRRLLPPARRDRPRVLLQPGRAAGHADGPVRGTDCRRGAQQL